MIQQRAEATFSPSALRAHWEARYGSWEAPEGAGWEVVPEDDWVMVPPTNKTPAPTANSHAANSSAARCRGTIAVGSGGSAVKSRGAFHASPNSLVRSKAEDELFWKDPMSKADNEDSGDEEEMRFFAGQRQRAKVQPVL